MSLERKQRIVVHHAVAVVNHANHALAAGFGFDLDGARAGIERVFEQLFYDGCRPLDDLARGDFVRHCFR